MAVPNFDLSAVAAERDVELQRGRAVVTARADDLAAKVISWASRAHRARQRLIGDDAEAGFVIERWCLRRLRADARRVVGADFSDTIREDVANLCGLAFADRLRVLETEGRA